MCRFPVLMRCSRTITSKRGLTFVDSAVNAVRPIAVPLSYPCLLIVDAELDFYGTVKLINYIRSCTGDGCTPQAIIETLQQSVPDNGRALWDDQKYMSPVVENDALLFCFDEASDSDSELVSLESLKAENAQLRSQVWLSNSLSTFTC